MIQGKLLSDWDLHQYDQSERVQIFFKLISKGHFSITKNEYWLAFLPVVPQASPYIFSAVVFFFFRKQ